VSDDKGTGNKLIIYCGKCGKKIDIVKEGYRSKNHQIWCEDCFRIGR
jgi:hypothetical protein